MATKTKYLLGIDIGTTYLKTSFIDTKGKVILEKRIKHKTASSKPNRYEQDPEEYYRNLLDLFSKIDEKMIERVEGISLSGQMHGMILVDNDGDPLTPNITWEDHRAERLAKKIETNLGWQNIKNTLGNRPMPGFTLPKLLWIKRNKPRIYSNAKTILLPKGFLRYKLTGEFAMEISDASSGLLIDIKKRDWAYDILNELGFDIKKLPELLESTKIGGRITDRVAKVTGFIPGTPVIAGAGDQQAGALGAGIYEEGEFSVTLGTGGQTYTVTDNDKVDPEGRVHTFCHCFPGEWQVMGAMKTAGKALEWLKDEILSPITLKESNLEYDTLDKLSKDAQPTSKGLVFLPYLTGERTPYLDPKAKGVFFGLTLDHGLPELVRSVMEGVSFNMRYALELLLDLDIPLKEIRLEGGGTVSKIWPQIQTDITNKELIITKSKYDKSAYGAAILAGIGLGIFSSLQELKEQQKQMLDEKKLEPNPTAVRSYEEAYILFKDLYTAVKNLY